MEPIEFYKQELADLEKNLKKLKQKKSSFAWLRLGAIAGIFLVFYFLWSMGAVYVAAGCILLVFIFIRLVHADLNNQAIIHHTKKLILINENEIKSINEDYTPFENGTNHITKDHPYSNDLDIFGPASLFQFSNRTTSQMGSYQLSEYLKAPSPIEEIELKQEAVKELTGKIKWIQNLQAEGKKEPITYLTKKRLASWMQEPPVFSLFKHWRWLRYLLPAIILTIIGLYIYDIVGDTIFYLTLLIFAAIAYQINKYVAPVHEQLSKIADELNTLSTSISFIEKEEFNNPLLKKLQAAYLHKNQKASKNIYEIKKILDKLDLRYNLVLSLPLNLLLLWNLQQMLDLEKWKSKQQENLGFWFDNLGHFEALNSFAILNFNNPDWVFPTINPAYFSISGTGIGHPLIPGKKRVDNPISIPAQGELMLITGSNMAGKSTYLRSIGVNTVLAMAGSPVCAKEFSVSHVEIISSMRITDNLEESTSTFYAELKKLKSIIEKVNNSERVFILLDEILRGTNSLDRHTGSKALIKQLIKKRAATIIATHDLELANIKNEYPDNILNYHFDVQVENDELFFDYQLKPGICTSLNASILMRKIGIEL
ncbi:MAG: hypothetical protein ABIW47_10410 [Ginsengibacter sp.]|jgi:DNA mismatch repair ATPase MutS